MTRAVLDTTITVSAIRSRHGASNAVVKLALDGHLTSLIDYRLSCEYRDVMLRAEHVSASPLSRREIIALIEEIEDVSEVVKIDRSFRPLSSDPDDDRILDLAINGCADVIVTHNIRHLVEPAAKFRIEVLSPREILSRIRQRR